MLIQFLKMLLCAFKQDDFSSSARIGAEVVAKHLGVPQISAVYPLYLEPMKRFCKIGNERIREITEALDEVYPVAISVYFEEYLAELKLTAIARGEGDPAAFMAGISDMARELVKTYSHISEEGQKLFAPEREAVGLCPRCGKPVYEGRKNFYCSDRACRFVLWKDDRFWTSRKKELTKKMAGDLLKKGRTSVKGMWSEKKGAAYDAVVVLDDTGEKYVRFKLEFPKRKEGVNGR